MRDTDDLYRILQVDPSAESETIEAAYKALAKKYHPDRNPSLDATQETQRLNHARDVLLNPRQRDKYDHKRRPADKGEQARQEAVRQRAAAERQARQETERRKDAERKVLSAQAEARKQADAAGKARKARAEEQHQRVRAEERVEVERRARTEAERRAAAEQRTREAAEESARKAWKMARRRASGESRRWSAWLMAAPVVLILAAAAAMLWNHPVQERIQSQGSQEPEPIQSQVGPPEPEPIQSQTLRSPGYLDEPAVAAAAMLWPAGAAYVDEVYEAERRQRREERRPGRVFRDCDRCPNMVVVPPGTFRMGSNDGVRTHQPLRDVRVRMFALGRYEVTVDDNWWCVQQRLVCSAGDSPAGVIVRSPVAWIAGRRETEFLKPIDKVSLGEICESSGHNASERASGLDSLFRRAEPATSGRRQHGRLKAD